MFTREQEKAIEKAIGYPTEISTGPVTRDGEEIDILRVLIIPETLDLCYLAIDITDRTLDSIDQKIYLAREIISKIQTNLTSKHLEDF